MTTPAPSADAARRVEARGLAPRALTLELTKGCNLRCGYCYYAQREDAYDPAVRMTPAVAERSVELLLEEGAAGEPIHLHFFGGEPLLALPLLEHTVLYAERRAAEEGRSATFEITTNGTRFSDEAVSFLNAHRVHVGVSFDGPPEIQDAARPAAGKSSYELAAPGIRRLIASRRGTDLEGEVHCTAVVTRRSFDLVAIVEHLEELGFRKIILAPVTDLSGATDGFRDEDLPAVLREYDRLAERFEAQRRAGREQSANWYPSLMKRLLSGERRLHYCQGGRDYLGVAADGKLSLCYRFYEDPNFAMGDVATGVDRGVTERLLAEPLDERTACSQCWARYFCGGGCHHDNVTVGGGLGTPNPVTCDIFRHGMSRTLEAWARLTRAGLLPRRLETPAAATATMTAAPAPLGADARPKRAAGCHLRELPDETVVYDPATHEICVLNPVAAYIFGLCDGGHTVADILARLADRYDAPGDVLERDLGRTLRELAAKRLIS